VIVAVANPDLVLSATDVAVTVTNGGSGASDGAVYRPDEVIVPQVELKQPIPLSPHVTAVLLVPVTAALNCCCAPVFKDGPLGVTVTPILFGPTMVAVVEPEIDPFESDVAVTVTTFGVGTVVGAV
jgi:hypothetical protein